MSDLIRVEFHCHTEYSKDSLTPLNTLLMHARKVGIGKLVITDHNTISGAIEAKKIDPQLVIVGEEILTSKGEILAVFVKEAVKPYMSPEQTIKILQEQDAFIVIPHPFDRRRHGWLENDLLAILPHIDAIEAFNARCYFSSQNVEAQKFSEKHHLAYTVGSDAHTLKEVGRATMELPDFQSATELREVLSQGKVNIQRKSSPFIHMTSFYARMRKRLKF